MTELREDWHDWRYDGRGYYLVNDPEITFQDDAEADAYCDEHNRALIGVAVQAERQRITAWLRQLDMPDGTTETIANWIDEGMHLP